jgi:NADH:ubiquinone oxidoreductase subunit F (NADH-binding)
VTAGRPAGTADAVVALTAEHRLLGGAVSGGGPGLAEHLARYGPLPPAPSGPALIELVERSGLRGRGGAGFPAGRKLAAVAAAASASGRRPAIVANGCEGEPVSGKDRTLLYLVPHLVLDGAAVAAEALGADEIVLCLHRDEPVAAELRTAIGERAGERTAARLVEVPGRYVASEESALVNFLENGVARPTTKPPRPFERGLGGRPTMISNVETLAHLALIARFGADWFRTIGTVDSPGSALVTIGGAVEHSQVNEVALGTPLGSILDRAGGFRSPCQALLVGGLGGGWLPLPEALGTPLAHAELRSAGAQLGVGSIVALPTAACGVTETAAIAGYLAGESARQCGPCMFGLPAVAADLWTLACQDGDLAGIPQRLHRRLGLLPGRGACGHPDGFARFVLGALRTFADDFRAHADGRPCPWAGRPTLPVPAHGQPTPDGWR